MFCECSHELLFILLFFLFLFGNSLNSETTDIEIFRALNVSFKQSTSSACAASLQLFYFFLVFISPYFPLAATDDDLAGPM